MHWPRLLDLPARIAAVAPESRIRFGRGAGLLLLAFCAVAVPPAARGDDRFGDAGAPEARPDSSRARHGAFAPPLPAPPGGSEDPAPAPGATLAGTWQRVAGPFDTPAVNRAAVVRDSRRHRMLLVDGYDFGVQWSLSLPATGMPQWSARSLAGPYPSPRIAFVAVYDSLRDRVVLHGGWDGTAVLSDTWTLGLGGASGWTQLLPADSTGPARDGHVAIVDPVRDRLVIFGGTYANCDTCRSGETWALSLSGPARWTMIAAAGAGPSPRTDASAVYDPWLDLMVVFGGWGAGSSLVAKDDAWSFRFGDGTWTPITSARHPQGRAAQVAVVDFGHQRMVVQGGYTYPDYRHGLGDAWTLPLRGPAAWDSLLAGGPAPVAFHHGAIYSPERHSLITYGGLASLGGLVSGAAPNSCYELDLERNAWAQVSPMEDPRAPARQMDSWMLADPVVPQVVVLDGGDTDWRCYDEPWGFSLADASGWTYTEVAGVAPRCGASCTVYDSRRDRVLSFGGDDVIRHGGRVNEISALPLHTTGATWQPLPIAGPLPMGREKMCLVYDAKRDRVLMFGGAAWARTTDDSPAALDDLWQLALGDTLRWTQLATSGTPDGRWQATALLDTLRDRLIVHGGIFSQAFPTGFYPRRLYDTWALPLGGDSLAWQRLGPDAPAEVRANADEVAIERFPILDTARDGLLLVDTSLPALYALSFAQPNAWEPPPVQRNTFPLRTGAAHTLDPAGDRVFVFGGAARGLLRADLNALQLVPPTRQVAMDVVVEDHGRDESAGSLRVTVFGSASFSVDSLLRRGATLAGARVRFEQGYAWHGGLRGPERRIFRDLLGHVPLAELKSVPADSVVALAAVTSGGMRVTGYARLRLPRSARNEWGPPAEADGGAGAPEHGVRVIGSPMRGASLTLKYALASGLPARFELLDVQGRRLVRGEVPVAADGQGEFVLPESRALAPGVYLVRLTQGERVFTARAVVLR